MHTTLPRKNTFHTILFCIIFLSLLGFSSLHTTVSAQEEQENFVEKKEVPNPFPKRIKAPDLSGGVEWLNTSGEINLRDLRGKVVLLDFWTFCCINCIHVLPDLAYLEKKFENELIVIGVHSAKFDNEKETNNIREAIKRYEISHPVVNDANMVIWQKMNAHSWPTLVLIDPEGYYCGFVSGEGNRGVLENAITKLIEFHRHKGTLDETPVHFDLERFKDKPTPLKYPGKLLTDEKSRRLFISDSNHNRIVISDWEGNLLDVVGSGEIGTADGSYEAASFDHPQGMELVGDTLYVADTENHMIRKVDLKNKTVETLSGTGEQSRFRAKGGPLKTTALNSPWALVHHDGTLYIAMAGPHQIWKHRIGSDDISVYAGSGREDILDGDLEKSAFAQPSGITTDGKALYLTDSEGSAIRKIELETGNVTTVVGESNLPRGQSLFSFGDVDGKVKEVRLQHPLGVTYSAGKLYITDTYNHKVKEITLSDKQGESTCRTIFEMSKDSESLTLSEPAGLALAGENLFIADTNNHRVLKLSLKDQAITVFEIKFLKPTKPPEVKKSFDEEVEVIMVEPLSIKPEETKEFQIELPMPEGYKQNKLFPTRVRMTSTSPEDLIPPDLLDKDLKPDSTDENSVTMKLPLSITTEEGEIDLQIRYGYCRDGVGGVCKVKTLRWKIPLLFDKNVQQTKVIVKQ